MSVVEPIYIAAAATDGAIRTAASAANAGGGGIVKIPAGSITLASALPMYNGVIYEGVPCRMDSRGGQTVGIGGTILNGNGTFNGFEYHPTDLGTPPTVEATFLDGMVQGAGILDVTIVNCTNGIKIGALYNPGANSCRFERVNIINCTQWGIWIENHAGCHFDMMNIINCAGGGRASVASGATAYNCGNGSWRNTFVAAANSGRGMVTWARGASSMNDEQSDHEQCNRSTLTISQAATMSNGAANITVTSGSAFAVDFPVTVSANANGFRANQIYFVASVAGNVITLRDTIGYGATKTATGATAVNILSRGWPCLEIAGLDASSNVTAQFAFGIDLEGSTSARVVMQWCTYCTVMGAFLGGASIEYRTFCLRNCGYGSISSHLATTYDIDANSLNTVSVSGTRSEYGGTNPNLSQGTGIGFSLNNVATGSGGNLKAEIYSGQLSLRGWGKPEIYSGNDSNFVGISVALMLDQTQIATGATIAGADTTSSFVNTTATTSSSTLPVITDYNVGTLIMISNPQNSVHTVNTVSSQTINGTPSTFTIAMAARTSVMLQACDAGGAIGKYWARYQ
jgi:hypothetical protein